jgi:PEP-CTERM motif
LRASGGPGRAELSSGGRNRGLQPVRRVRQQFDPVRHGDGRHNGGTRDGDADGFEFKTITGQSSDSFEYTVNADTAGNAAQLSLVLGVHSLVGYGGSSLSPDTTLNGISLKGGGANPSESSPVPEPSIWALMLVGFAGVGFFAVRRAGKATAATTA